MAKSKPFHTTPHSVFAYGAKEFEPDSTVSVKITLTAYCQRNFVSKEQARRFIKEGWLLATRSGRNIFVSVCNQDAIDDWLGQ